MSNDQLVKVFFSLDVDEDGYPPVSSESLNATILEDGNVRLSNTPFFVEGVSLGDVVAVEEILGANKGYWFKEVVEQSDTQSLSIIFIDLRYRDEILQKLLGFDCACEYGEFSHLKMLAVSVPRNSNYDEIHDYLAELEEREIVSFAELAIL